MCEAYRNLKTEIWCILRCYGWRIEAASARDPEGATSKVGQNQQGGTKTRKVWHPGSQTQKVFQEIGRNQPY